MNRAGKQKPHFSTAYLYICSCCVQSHPANSTSSVSDYIGILCLREDVLAICRCWIQDIWTAVYTVMMVLDVKKRSNYVFE